MNQYTPVRRANIDSLDRTLQKREYDEIIDYAYDLGIRNAYVQEDETQKESFIPDFFVFDGLDKDNSFGECVMERIQKIIAERGYCSRRRAEELMLAGKVKVNGMVVRELGTKASSNASIEVEGIALDNNKNYEYYLLYKPRGVVSSVTDDRGRKTVVDLITGTDTRIYPIGRLDYDTSGLILLTNDGNLANGLMQPAKKIEKSYIVKGSGILTGYDIKRLKDGVIIDGYKTRRAKVKLKSSNIKKNTCLIELVITEGKNRQIRKMIEAVGKSVLKLKRERYAFLTLDGLKSGEYRKLSNKEIAILYSLIK